MAANTNPNSIMNNPPLQELNALQERLLHEKLERESAVREIMARAHAAAAAGAAAEVEKMASERRAAVSDDRKRGKG